MKWRTITVRWLLLTLTLTVITASGFGLIASQANTQQQPRDRNRVIFVPGICSTGPVGTETQPNTFWEMYRWLADDLGYETFRDPGSPADIYGFSYGTQSALDIDPENISYDPTFTKLSIPDTHAQSLRLMILNLATRYPGERFDIIGHSMGGVVALYTAATYPDVRELLRSVLTINSPVQGIGEVREFFSSVLLPCMILGEDSAAVHDMDANGTVITAIKNTAWNSEEFDALFVATIANVCDAVVTNLLNGYPGADLGTLPNADFNNTFVADTSGCGPTDLVNVGKLAYEHKAPLLINSNSAASPTVDAALASLVANWDLQVPFMGGTDRLVTTLAPSQQKPLALSVAFVANGDSEFSTPLTKEELRYNSQALTGAFVGNGTTEVESILSNGNLDFSPNPLSSSFVGNGDGIISEGLSLGALDYNPKALSGSFVGNGDAELSVRMTDVHLEPEPLSHAFVGNGNTVTTSLMKPRLIDVRCVHDANSSGTTERDEAVAAVTSFLLSLTDITRPEAVEVVTSYLLSQSFEC